MKPHAVSSRTSRTSAAMIVSPLSTWPAGWLKTRRLLIRSSTTRKRPSLSLTAATVMSGFHAMRDIITAGEIASRSCSATPCDSQSLFGGACIPDAVELGQIEFSYRGIVEVGDPIPGVGAHAVGDRAVIGDQISRGALRRFGGNVADVDAA